MAVIEVENIWKSFRIYHERALTLKEVMLVRRSQFETFWALKGVSLEVDAGEMLALVGANGSGKSTMLKTIARILTPNSGRLSVEGRVSSMLELGTGFHPELSGHDNIYLAGSIMGISTRDMQKRYDEIIEFADIGDFVETPVKNYSSGMFARLAFALAVNVDADVLLIDEVLAVGDADFQLKCQERIREIRHAGMTIVFVSHGLDVVRTLCDRAVWLEHGEIRRSGTSSEVISDYLETVYETGDQLGAWVAPAVDDRVGTGEIRISRVAFLGENDDEPARLESGRGVTIDIQYEAIRDIAEVVIAIEVWRDGSRLSSIRSDSHAKTFDVKRGGGTIDLRMPSFPFAPATYQLTIGAHDPMRHQVYDWLQQAFVFDVKGSREHDSPVHIAGQWCHNDELTAGG